MPRQQDTKNELGEYLDGRFPDSVIRSWSNGHVEMSIDNPSMSRQEEEISNEDLPHFWEVDNVIFARRGITFEFEHNPPEDIVDEMLEWVIDEANYSGIKLTKGFPLIIAKTALRSARDSIKEYRNVK